MARDQENYCAKLIRQRQSAYYRLVSARLPATVIAPERLAAGFDGFDAFATGEIR